jgi:hypothetical protein
LAVAFAIANLENPKAANQKQKDRDHRVLESGDPPERKTGVILREPFRSVGPKVGFRVVDHLDVDL